MKYFLYKEVDQGWELVQELQEYDELSYCEAGYRVERDNEDGSFTILTNEVLPPVVVPPIETVLVEPVEPPSFLDKVRSFFFKN